jgi:hypothetical protein
MKKILWLALLLPAFAFAQGIPIKDGATAGLAKVNASGALMTNEGPSSRVTYIATVSGATTTATWNLACEAGTTVGFKISQFCVTLPGGATAAAGPLVWALRRSTAAGSGGTALAADGTGTTSVSRMDTVSGTFPGTCRGLASTLGTAGATIDQGSWNESAGVNLATITFCKNYGMNGDQLPTVPAGAANGIYITVAAAGAGSLAVGAATMVLVTEQ